MKLKRALCLLLVLLSLLSLIGCAPYAEIRASEWNDPGFYHFQTGDTAEAPHSTAQTETPETDTLQAKRTLPEDGVYDDKDSVALYIHLYGHLPSNYVTKSYAKSRGWKGGALKASLSGKCIGGSYFGNYEKLLPEAPDRFYTECDIDTMYASSRGVKRIVFSNDGLIYYTDDHYETFELLYGGE